MKELVIKGTRTSLLAVFVIAAFLIAATVSSYAAMDEEECNDTWQDANKITMGTTVYGTTEEWCLGTAPRDCFTFKPPVSGTAKITIYADKVYEDLDPDEERVYAYVYDSNDNDLVYVCDGIDDSSGDYDTFGVKYGHKYYVEVHSEWPHLMQGRKTDYHFNISYSIGKTTITKVTGKDNAFKVKWNKKSKASFYQVRYVKKSSYEDYGWSKAKKIKVGKKYGTKTVRKLGNKKRYYVQVRVARTIKGKTYYSPWSNRKVVKTK